jgi:magnesium chelatase family protein
MLVKIYGAAVQGIDATIVTIEVNSARGIRFFLVGLPDSAVKESHERIISAFQVNGYRFPSRQIVVNMAPADIRRKARPTTCLWPSASWPVPKLSTAISSAAS